MWSDFDKDTIAQYPKDLLPKDAVVYPVVRYQQVSPGEWQIKPGLAREYILHFHYKNMTGKAVVARLQIIDSKGVILQNRPIVFPATSKKYKILSSTTGTQINAGLYRVLITGIKNIDFEILEVQ
ncbi:MAG TPA: hypothetical protein DCS83_03610 [Prevotella sp.]|nr:hypothetical protein [Prevotella sp.]